MRNLNVLAFCILILFVVISSLPQAREAASGDGKTGSLQITTSKAEYMLGEPVRLDWKFTVQPGLDGKIDFESTAFAGGAFKVFIARDREEFLQYKFSGWVSDHKVFAGEKRFASAETIFFNQKPETGHLSDYGRREAEKGMILTDYAFPEPGTYRIKAVWSFNHLTNKEIIPERVESNEISFRIVKPEGDDLKVWEVLKADPRIGYFMTAGSAPYRVPSIQDSLLVEIDKVVADYPNSYLSGMLREKVSVRRAQITAIRQQDGPNKKQ